MENIILLPAWANILFMAAVGLLIINTLVGKLKGRIKPKLDKLGKDGKEAIMVLVSVAYYVVAVIILVGIAIYFFKNYTITHTFFAAIGAVMCFIFGLCTTLEACSDGFRGSAEERAWFIIFCWALAIASMVFIAMLVTSIAFAFMWLGAVLLLGIIGWFLWPDK